MSDSTAQPVQAGSATEFSHPLLRILARDLNVADDLLQAPHEQMDQAHGDLSALKQLLMKDK